MTYLEKNTFIKLLSLSFLMLYFLFRLYFIYVEERFNAETLSDLWINLIVISLVVLILATILAQVLPVISYKIKTGEKKQEQNKIEDERDKLIDLKVTKITYTIFTLGTFIAMLTFTLGKPAVIMFTMLIFVGLASHIIGDIVRLWLYRRGF